MTLGGRIGELVMFGPDVFGSKITLPKTRIWMISCDCRWSYTFIITCELLTNGTITLEMAY